MNDKMNDAMDEAKEKGTSFLKDMKKKMDKVVQFNGMPEVLLKLRKRVDVVIPFAPDLRITVGTDVKLCDAETGFQPNYAPNFQWSLSETWFNGEIEVDTMNKEVKYCKVFDLDSVALKVSGNYNYLHNAPYFGFQVMTTSGLSSPANANGFSFAKTIRNEYGPAVVETEVEASVVMGETKYNPVAKKVQQSPAQVNIQKVETMLTV